MEKIKEAGFLKLSEEKILSDSTKTEVAFSLLARFYKQVEKDCSCALSLCLLDNPVVDNYGDTYSEKMYEDYKNSCKAQVARMLRRPIRHFPEFTFPRFALYTASYTE